MLPIAGPYGYRVFQQRHRAQFVQNLHGILAVLTQLQAIHRTLSGVLPNPGKSITNCCVKFSNGGMVPLVGGFMQSCIGQGPEQVRDC